MEKNKKTEIYLAPLQGITNKVYADIYHKLFKGVDYYCAPFIKVQLHRLAKRKRKKLALPEANENIPFIPQILSNDSREFYQFDQDLQELGYQEFNWNLGCPFRMVANKKRGSGLLPHADQIKTILDEVMGNLHCRLSLKVRLGFTKSEEILELIPIFNQYPIHELIIHPRIGTQLYTGQVDLKRFAECLALSKHPVVYNGDIFNLVTYNTLQKQFPQINKWMLGRGILANPFLPAQIKGSESGQTNKLERIIQFHDNYAGQYEKILSGPTHIVDKLKEFWSFGNHVFEDGNSFYHQLKKVKHYDAYKIMVQKFFATQPVVLDHVIVNAMDSNTLGLVPG
ncbi:tRNA-dihydrouridine synthase family protein [bacterium]|nr:tRNA-dihydrouridine synthase family protein [bacterium]